MTDLVQTAIVTVAAGVALTALVKPSIFRRSVKRTSSGSGDAGCPGCGACDTDAEAVQAAAGRGSRSR